MQMLLALLAQYLVTKQGSQCTMHTDYRCLNTLRYVNYHWYQMNYTIFARLAVQ